MGDSLKSQGMGGLMRENIKEVSFIICAIAIGCSNLATFILIALFGFAPIVYEPVKIMLYVEMSIALGFVVWGFERLRQNIRRE